MLNSNIVRLDSNKVNSHSESDTAVVLQRTNAIFVIKTLCELSKVVQKHRGASIACIDGDEQFLPLVSHLQTQVRQIFQVLYQCEERQTMIGQTKLDAIVSDWRTIQANWQQDTVIQNYEFHGHLIEVLRVLQRSSIDSYLLNTELSINNPGFTQGIHTLFYDIPEYIELLAKLRGLSTHVLVSKNCDHDYAIRISFLRRTVQKESKNLNRTLKKMSDPFSNMAPLNELSDIVPMLDEFLLRVDQSILERKKVRGSSRQLFVLATKVIEFYWRVVVEGFSILDRYVFDHYLNPEDDFNLIATRK